MGWTPKAGVLLAVVVGAIAFGSVVIPLTSHPKLCAGCHTIRPSYESWMASSHKEVGCVECHVRPGITGWLHDKAWAGTRDVALYLSGRAPDAHNLEARVATEVCLGCHREILRVSEVAPRDLPRPVKDMGLIMSHRKHMEAFAKRSRGEGCTTCHSGVVHGTPIKGYPIVIPRGHVAADKQPYFPNHPEGSKLRATGLADCFRCHDGKSEHDGKVLSRKCETCHLPERISQSLFD